MLGVLDSLGNLGGWRDVKTGIVKILRFYWNGVLVEVLVVHCNYCKLFTL